MSLVAEGFKRLGTLSYLIRNGSVKKGSVLFWDEPEMNLNASHLPVLVKTLTGLAKTGVQVMLSSHSLFLLRELMIQLSEPRNAMVQRKFFRDERAAGGTFRGKGVLGGIPGGRGAYRVS